MYRELLIGCGNHRQKLLSAPGHEVWSNLTTLDMDPNCGAEVVWDLSVLPMPFEAEEFDEVHAYHVLEHTGNQGDYKRWFAEWSEFYRLLKPGGLFCGIVPAPGSPWVFGDPGHTRFIPPEMLTFLVQPEYDKQVGVTALADYRWLWRGDFDVIHTKIDDNGQFLFGVRAVKPSRCSL